MSDTESSASSPISALFIHLCYTEGSLCPVVMETQLCQRCPHKNTKQWPWLKVSAYFIYILCYDSLVLNCSGTGLPRCPGLGWTTTGQPVRSAFAVSLA